jgi:hypothetical protein
MVPMALNPVVHRLRRLHTRCITNVDGGYLCSELSTACIGSQPDVPPSSGMVEFCCPVPALQPGLYDLDLTLESPGISVIDTHLICSVCRLTLGKRCWVIFISITPGGFWGSFRQLSVG